MLRTRPRFLSIVERIDWGWVAYGLACSLPFGVAIVIKLTALPVPFEDEWAWTQLLYRMHVGNLGFVDLWQQHNEHRMLFTNLIMLGLAMLGGWSQLRETFFSLILVVVTQIGLLVMLRRIVPLQRLPFVLLSVSLLLYSLSQMENWDWGFQFGWFLCNLCAVWAFVFIGAAGQSWFALLAAIVLAGIASFSLSQGLMVWAGGLAALLLTEKRNATQIAGWMICAVLAFVLYFHNFVHPTAHPDLLFGLHHPLTSFRYFGAYFGAVFAAWTNFGITVAVGWFGLIFMCLSLFAVVLDHRSDRIRASRAAGFVGIAVYVLAVAAITMVGRVGFGEAQAEASRYTSIAIYCWITIFALSVAYEDRLRAWLSSRIFSLWPAALALLAALYIGSGFAGYALGTGRLAVVRSAYPALIAGYGPELIALFPVVAPVEEYIRELHAIKDGPYYE